VIAGEAPARHARRLSPRRSQQIFYAVFLPLGAAANLALGLIVLTGMSQQDDLSWLKLATGAFCCVVAGWLAAAAWSRFYWNRSMARQVALWRRIADAIFAWLEETPLPAESLRSLQTSLDDVVPTHSTAATGPQRDDLNLSLHR
jgi:hypothetical protein